MIERTVLALRLKSADMVKKGAYLVTVSTISAFRVVGNGFRAFKFMERRRKSNYISFTRNVASEPIKE